MYTKEVTNTSLAAGEKPRVGSNLGRTQMLQPVPKNSTNQNSQAQCQLPPCQGRSTPEPAQQHPWTKVGDTPHAWHSLVVPKPSLAATGVQLELLCPSDTFTLSSAHLLQLM